MVASLVDEIKTALTSPEIFAALEPNGATKPGLSAQVLAAMAREALTHAVPGVTFNEITAHRDEQGQLMKIEVDYLDEIHDPTSRTTVVAF